jgi:hypothetical protein
MLKQAVFLVHVKAELVQFVRRVSGTSLFIMQHNTVRANRCSGHAAARSYLLMEAASHDCCAGHICSRLCIDQPTRRSLIPLSICPSQNDSIWHYNPTYQKQCHESAWSKKGNFRRVILDRRQRRVTGFKLRLFYFRERRHLYQTVRSDTL